jgi:competence ComEA-like helix-hairpin-helix protein
MSLDDRDYMRKRLDHQKPVSSRAWWQRLSLTSIVGAIAAVAGVVTLIAMLVSDVSYLSRFWPSREGTLVVNINTASAGEIETLPGIGPAIATLIIADRPYETIEDLERIQGIGPVKMRSLRPLVIVEGDTRKR